eukprot:1145876-Pelagomonas_calceolata.AAC.1
MGIGLYNLPESNTSKTWDGCNVKKNHVHGMHAIMLELLMQHKGEPAGLTHCYDQAGCMQVSGNH